MSAILFSPEEVLAIVLPLLLLELVYKSGNLPSKSLLPSILVASILVAFPNELFALSCV